MAFRVKDLMISVVPAKKAGSEPGCGFGGETMLCGLESATAHTHPTTFMLAWSPWFVCGALHSTTFPPISQTCCHCHTSPVSISPDNPVSAAEQLAALRAQLTKAVAEIEAQEKLLAEQSQPQTLEEIEDLQVKLKEAQAELEKRKAQLKKH